MSLNCIDYGFMIIIVGLYLYGVKLWNEKNLPLHKLIGITLITVSVFIMISNPMGIILNIFGVVLTISDLEEEEPRKNSASLVEMKEEKK